MCIQQSPWNTFSQAGCIPLMRVERLLKTVHHPACKTSLLPSAAKHAVYVPQQRFRKGTTTSELCGYVQ